MSYNQFKPLAGSTAPAARVRDIKVARLQERLYLVDGEAIAHSYESAWTESDFVVDALVDNIHCFCVPADREEHFVPAKQKLLCGSLFPAPMSLSSAPSVSEHPRSELYAPVYFNW